MSETKQPTKNNTLIVYLKEPKDWQIVKKFGIYRIRNSIKHPPKILKDRSVENIAFYLPSRFGKNKYSIRHYAKVKNVSIAPRYQCCPNEKRNFKSTWNYYKIDVEIPQLLQEPIYHFRAAKKKLSRGQMIMFPTTYEKLITAQELNFLYNGSYLEERMWKMLLDNNIYPEREWPVRIDKSTNYYLDFAVFCNEGQFCIEVDGKQHLKKEHVISDTNRTNNTNSESWKTFRFYEHHLRGNAISKTIELIRKEISNRKGLDTEKGLFPSAPKGGQVSSQMELFSEQHLDFLALRKRVKERFESDFKS